MTNVTDQWDDLKDNIPSDSSKAAEALWDMGDRLADHIEKLEKQLFEINAQNEELGIADLQKQLADLTAQNEALKTSLKACAEVQQRVQEDTYWRTADNSLWSDLCDATTNARVTLGEEKPDEDVTPPSPNF